MTLVKCSECGREVSVEATSCPGCGAPTPYGRERRSTLLLRAGLLIALLGLLVAAAFNRSFAYNTVPQRLKAGTILACIRDQVGGLSLAGLLAAGETLTEDMCFPTWARAARYGFETADPEQLLQWSDRLQGY